MLKTHYLKTQSKSMLGSRLESLVYLALPDDELCTSEWIYYRLGHVCADEGEEVPSIKTFHNIMKFFVEQGFAKEFSGPRLQKLLA